jgi:ribosome-associated protein
MDQRPHRASGRADRDESLGVSRDTPASRRPHDGGARELAIEAARLLTDDKCEDVLVLDLQGHSEVTDFFVIASGTSDRQMRSAGLHVEALAKERGFTLHRSNLKEREATWLILDFFDLVVHLFEPETRLFYDLEMLWGDVDRLDWQRDRDREPGDARPGPPGSTTSRENAARNRAGLRDDDVLPDASE